MGDDIEQEHEDLFQAIAYIDHQLQDTLLSRTTRIELMAHKRIIQRMIEVDNEQLDELH